MIGIATAILAGNVDLDVFVVTAAQSWQSQVRGVYAILYPEILRDFRGIVDCNTCHQNLAMAYASAPAIMYHNHGQPMLPPFNTMDSQTDRGTTPPMKTGVVSTDIYGA